MLKTAFVILTCKALSLVGRMVGKGSSLPGKICLRMDPNILKKIQLPSAVMAVTGSNGKTSTVENSEIARAAKQWQKSGL